MERRASRRRPKIRAQRPTSTMRLLPALPALPIATNPRLPSTDFPMPDNAAFFRLKPQ